MITLTINGKPRQIDAPEDMPLLWALRDELDLKGTKFGCGVAQCGACTVHIDGEATRACVTAIGSLDGAKITTIEGIGDTREGRALQTAWLELDVMQCGYCQAGQIMTAAAALTERPKLNRAQAAEAMNGNICRCGCYNRIGDAVAAVAQKLEGGARAKA